MARQCCTSISIDKQARGEPNERFVATEQLLVLWVGSVALFTVITILCITLNIVGDAPYLKWLSGTCQWVSHCNVIVWVLSRVPAMQFCQRFDRWRRMDVFYDLRLYRESSWYLLSNEFFCERQMKMQTPLKNRLKQMNDVLKSVSFY